ncbi:Histone acetyltransferase type B catalytic subunit [Strongyloides ratti]|uniref:Histone acetyltransferase type B catalytic subunit n=1 Tax=Strongyloides ratti TaxID=34506 RepID=A0A090L4W7_STRRB|nr:Histone acetyltransferase type B catalytic subunit [Strongyloides ratti]CEF64841.1 Histone acetyltransferase type B catalytic subunit [Strongyloides ratti]
MATIPDDVFDELHRIVTNVFEEKLIQKQQEEELGEGIDSQQLRSFTQEENEWVSNAMDVIKIHMVEPSHSLEDTPGYSPLFVHQFFNDEKVFGYKDLKIDIYFCASTMYFHPIISYSSTSKEIIKTMEPDDILKHLKSELPDWHMEIYKETRTSFEEELRKQLDFKPYGEVVHKFTNDNQTFELWGPPQDINENFNNYVNRIQLLALFDFETGDYTDNDDEKFVTYILYAVTKKPESDDLFYSVAGYATIYRYYVYPENIRPRIAHFLLTAKYRGKGIGTKFYKSIINELSLNPKVVDITIEDPSDYLIYCRDYVDFLTLKDHPEFSEEKLKTGYNKEMEEIGHKKYKMNPKQVRRIYEILRLYYTDETNKDEMKAYRIDVKRRLEKPMKRTKKELDRLAFLAVKDRHYLSALEANNPEVKQPQLQKLFEKQIEEYKCVLDRLKKYENI